mmetsp:Transcript_22268/g.65641  ORF Transcript_22268/g.65641 Transcript_22268/m.65641 type:complete len:240 (+) Transcript_22268:221-940(+)
MEGRASPRTISFGSPPAELGWGFTRTHPTYLIILNPLAIPTSASRCGLPWKMPRRRTGLCSTPRDLTSGHGTLRPRDPSSGTRAMTSRPRRDESHPPLGASWTCAPRLFQPGQQSSTTSMFSMAQGGIRVGRCRAVPSASIFCDAMPFFAPHLDQTTSTAGTCSTMTNGPARNSSPSFGRLTGIAHPQYGVLCHAVTTRRLGKLTRTTRRPVVLSPQLARGRLLVIIHFVRRPEVRVQS